MNTNITVVAVSDRTVTDFEKLEDFDALIADMQASVGRGECTQEAANEAITQLRILRHRKRFALAAERGVSRQTTDG